MRGRTIIRVSDGPDGVPFDNVEDAWFWGLQGYLERLSGARVVAGMALVSRPCEPGDIIRCFNRLVAEGKITEQQRPVMLRCGQQMMAPDRGRADNERRINADARHWEQGLFMLRSALKARGIVREYS